MIDIDSVIHEFRTTNSVLVRNELAIVLGESGRPQAKEALIAALHDDKLCGHRGTIIYALRDYEFNDLSILTQCVINGNYEEANMAIIIIEKIETIKDDMCLDRLHQARDQRYGWRREAIEYCISLFDCENNSGCK